MKQKFYIIILIMNFLGLLIYNTSCVSDSDYKPEKYWNTSQQDSLLFKLMRYITKPPKRVNPHDKFDPIYDSYYKDRVIAYQLDKYYISSQDNYHYYLVSRTVANEQIDGIMGIGGRFIPGENGDFIVFEEIFRTFVFNIHDYKTKSAVLFKAMIKDGNVERFHTDRVKEKFVQFPDKLYRYNREKRKWELIGVYKEEYPQ